MAIRDALAKGADQETGARVRISSSPPNMVRWCNGLTCLSVTEESTSSILVRTAI